MQQMCTCLINKLSVGFVTVNHIFPTAKGLKKWMRIIDVLSTPKSLLAKTYLKF